MTEITVHPKDKLRYKVTLGKYHLFRTNDANEAIKDAIDCTPSGTIHLRKGVYHGVSFSREALVKMRKNGIVIMGETSEKASIQHRGKNKNE